MIFAQVRLLGQDRSGYDMLDQFRSCFISLFLFSSGFFRLYHVSSS